MSAAVYDGHGAAHWGRAFASLANAAPTERLRHHSARQSALWFDRAAGRVLLPSESLAICDPRERELLARMGARAALALVQP